MRYSYLGRTGLRVSKLALGTATFGVSPDLNEAERLVHAALDRGMNFFDCANSYGNQPHFDRPGLPPAADRIAAEQILGKAIGVRRKEVILCTKVCERVGSGVNDAGLSRRHIFAQVEESLRRFETDYIDVYYAHHPDPDTPIEESLRAFDDLIRDGKIRHYALSTFSAWQITEALWQADRRNLATPACHQVCYNLGARVIENDIVPVCTRYGLSLTVFGPLGGGIFAGGDILSRKFSGNSRWGGPGFSSEQIGLGLQLQAIAEQSGYPPAHLAISWLLTRPAVASAIIGPESVEELTAIAGSVDLEINGDLLTAVNAVGEPDPLPIW